MQPVTGRAVLILKPDIAHGKTTQAVVDPYSTISIHHLTLKLYTVNGEETFTGISRTILQAQLDNPILFGSLKANTHYRVKAFAYLTSDDSQLISTSDANSYTDVTLTNDDRPTMETLNVKLIDRPFNFQSTGSLNIVSGTLLHPAAPDALVTGIQGSVSVLVGNGGATNTDGTGTAATIKAPQYLVSDSSGNLYVTCNFRVRKIAPDGTISPIAGGDTTGTADGQGAAASFTAPRGITLDNHNNLYVTDGNTIRQVTMAGNVTRVAGGSTAGFADGYGTAAAFSSPYGIAFDGQRYLYVADYSNRRIRRIDPDDGFKVETFAGSGAAGMADGTGIAAQFYLACGIVSDGKGNLYVTEFANTITAAWSRVRKIDTNTAYVSTLFGANLGGTSNGYGTAAKLSAPKGIAIDQRGNFFITDSKSPRIRKIAPNNYVSYLAGAGTVGSSDGLGPSASFNSPTGITVDASGTVYVADTTNNRIRKIQ